MDTIAAPRRIGYRTTPEGDLPMEVYAPPDAHPGERRPAVVFLHGGPVPPQLPPATEWGGYRGLGRLVATSGWVGVAFKHRFYSYCDDHDYDQLEQAEEDISAAITYVRAHAQDLGVDADRLCLWAFSGGGHFMAAPLRERPAHVRCLVGYYAVMDLRPVAGAGERADPAAMARLARYSPAAVLEESGFSGAPPILLARAGKDHPALNAGIDAFTQATLTANLTLDVLNHPAGAHGFDTATDDARTREIITHTLAFIRERFA
jgi:acetyl esterase/lipase